MAKSLQKLTMQEKEELSATIEKLANFAKPKHQPRTQPAAFYGRQVEEDDSMHQTAQVAEKFGLKESFFDYFEIDKKQ